jgi:hypothetical protein
MKISYEILVSNCLYIVNRARVSHSCDQFGLRLNTETGLLGKFPGPLKTKGKFEGWRRFLRARQGKESSDPPRLATLHYIYMYCYS